MSTPKLTGISSITGKTVTIRHATEEDLVDVRERLAARRRGDLDLSYAEVVVALEDGRLIGFGILERDAVRENTGCVTLYEDKRRRGIGASILRHLDSQGIEVSSEDFPEHASLPLCLI